MPNNLVATEEIRDALGLADGPRTAAWIALDLAISESTVRRHARLLIERGWLTKAERATGDRRTVYALTETGRAAYEANVGL